MSTEEAGIKKTQTVIMNNEEEIKRQTGGDTIRAGAAGFDVSEESKDADNTDITYTQAYEPVSSDDESSDAEAANESVEDEYISEESDKQTDEEPADGEDEAGDAQADEDEEPDAEGPEDAESDEADGDEESGAEESDDEGSDAGSGEDEEPAGEDDEEDQAAPEKDPEIEAIKQKIRERKREKRRKARLRKVRFWTVLSVIFFTVGGMIFSLSGFFTVDSIEVRGNSHFTAEEIINIAHAVPGHNLIYNPDKKSITDYLEQNPYIKSAEVSRKLPSTLVITVNEREQACAFKYDDDYLVMDDEGILLKKTRTEPKLTIVKGLVVTKIRLGDTIGTENQQMFSKLLRLIRAMKSGDLYFVRIDMTSYTEDHIVRAYVYNKLMVKADYDALMTNIDNGRLHRVLEKLFEEGTKRGTITFGTDGSAAFEPGI